MKSVAVGSQIARFFLDDAVAAVGIGIAAAAAEEEAVDELPIALLVVVTVVNGEAAVTPITAVLPEQAAPPAPPLARSPPPRARSPFPQVAVTAAAVACCFFICVVVVVVFFFCPVLSWVAFGLCLLFGCWACAASGEAGIACRRGAIDRLRSRNCPTRLLSRDLRHEVRRWLS